MQPKWTYRGIRHQYQKRPRTHIALKMARHLSIHATSNLLPQCPKSRSRNFVP